jgi:hypothetical protein
MSKNFSTFITNSDLAISVFSIISDLSLWLGSVTFLGGESWLGVGVVLALVLIPLILLGGIIVAFVVANIPVYAELKEKKRIMTTGFTAEARILSIEQEDSGEIRDSVKVKFELEVYPANHPKFTGRAEQRVEIVHIPSYQPEKMVQVKYLPETTKVVIVGLTTV